MKKYIILILAISLLGLFARTCLVEAGFGVSPPAVICHHLIPGSHFEETIYLVRGNPSEDMEAEITIGAPEVEDWITIENGLYFPLPEGEKLVPMKVIVDVPSDAAYGNYRGYIQARAIGISKGEGQVATVLGGRIDINLTVSEKGFADFEVKVVTVPNIERGDPLTVMVMIENLGNVDIAPAKAHVDIYDIAHQKLIQSGDIEEMSLVRPFETKQSEGEMPVEIIEGEYWADVTVYKNEEPFGPYKIHFRVLPPGTLRAQATQEGEGIGKETIPYILAGIILLVAAIVLVWIEKKSKKIIPQKTEEKENNSE